MEIQSTTKNPVKWRLWHWINYLIGGVTFFFGSIILYDYFSSKFDNALFSGWLYTIGSACFLLADLTQWTHYQQSIICVKQAKTCQHRSLSINFFASVCGSAIYLIGSIMFIPAIDLAENGFYTFIVGSSVIALSQTCKICSVAFEKTGDGILKNLSKDLSGFFVDLFAGLGGLMYLIGSILYLSISIENVYIGTTLYSFGGSFFYTSGLFMMKRYFFTVQKMPRQRINQQSSIDSKQKLGM